jgi:hypothetical protein
MLKRRVALEMTEGEERSLHRGRDDGFFGESAGEVGG